MSETSSLIFALVCLTVYIQQGWPVLSLLISVNLIINEGYLRWGKFTSVKLS